MKKILILCLSLFSLSNHAYERIISLGGTLTEIVYALGEGEKVVGVDMSSIYPQAATKVEQLGYRQNISLEGIISLKPDLILASSKMVTPDLLSQLKKLKLNVISVKEEDSFESAREKITLIAKTLNHQDKGKALISKIDADLTELKKINAQGTKKVIFIYARGGNRVYLSGNDTPAHKMIELSGVTNAFDQVKGFKPITSESLVMSNPQAIIMLKSGAESLKDGVWSIKGLDQTIAGKNKKLILADDSAFLGFGPRSSEVLLKFKKEVQSI